ncbi:U-box domain-containing protein 33-like [Aristolochia californica]|uniref:U-box domain-containing protein 33-like n=1 Tax=Aristolochia californica TaxID=171875 RepID=UPI0035D8503D
MEMESAEMMSNGLGLEAVMSPEIVEISEESKGFGGDAKDVYVAVGKDDLDALKWALQNSVCPGSRVFLIHVCPPICFIPTPVGKLSKSQVGADQWKSYVNLENVRRRNILQKYIRLCADSKVTVETMLIESDLTAKAIVELISVLNITKLVMGRKRSSSSSSHRRLRRKGSGKSEFVRKNAPDFCEVFISCGGNNVAEEAVHGSESSSPPSTTSQEPERKFLECICFSGKRYVDDS